MVTWLWVMFWNWKIHVCMIGLTKEEPPACNSRGALKSRRPLLEEVEVVEFLFPPVCMKTKNTAATITTTTTTAPTRTGVPIPVLLTFIYGRAWP